MRLILLLVFCVAVAGLPSASQAAQSSNPARRESAKASSTVTVVNINTASLAELQTLPGIGAKVAARIVEYREKNGAFKKIEELMNVQGIGEKSFLKLRPQLSVGAKADAGQHQ